MNYYKLGDATNADKIKAAFERLGYDTRVNGWNFNADCGVYFTNEADKSVDYTSIETFVNLINSHPDYKELELPVEPKFKVGNWYLCVKDVYGRGVRFDKGNAYHCGKDGCLQQVDSGAHISIVEELYEYFRPWTIADAKDGDVLAADECYVIFKKIDGLNIKCYCTYHYMGFNPSFHIDTLQNKAAFSTATKEQRDLLFAKMKEAGYEWDEKKKELCKIKPHYDIANFQPFDKVLVRDRNDEPWRIAFYGYYNEEAHYSHFVGTCWSKQCIPFNKDTEHLLGTTDMPSEEYINW